VRASEIRREMEIVARSVSFAVALFDPEAEL
jgi:hypothetical protein